MKNLKNLGKTLNKTEQKEIFGGRKGSDEPVLCAEGTMKVCQTDADCCSTADEACVWTTIMDNHLPFDVTQVGGHGGNWSTQLRCM